VCGLPRKSSCISLQLLRFLQLLMLLLLLLCQECLPAGAQHLKTLWQICCLLPLPMLSLVRDAGGNTEELLLASCSIPSAMEIILVVPGAGAARGPC